MLARALQATVRQPESGGSSIEVYADNGYVEVSLTLPTAFTFSAWCKSSASDDVLFGNNLNAGFFLRTNPTTWELYAGSGWVFSSAGSRSAGVWQHVALSHDQGTGDWELFLDGNSVSTGNKSATLTATDTRIGSKGGSTPGYTWLGSIDDVRIYNRALTESECATLAANRGGNVLTSGLVVWYEFEDGTPEEAVTSVTDTSGNANHGTPTDLTYKAAT